MNVSLKVLTAGVLFFTGQAITAQEAKKDSLASNKEKEIEEVVVVGYQKKKSDQVSSSVTVISSDALSKFNVSTMGTNALQGKAAGVEITSLNGKPGGGSSINIRGLGNITTSVGASNPLFVIDGFIVGNDQRAQDIFNAINPSDYESISILKDAAAASIYGSQGANGVVVLTTKSGKLGKPIISFKSTTGYSHKIKDINFSMMNAEERIKYQNQMAALGITGYTTIPENEISSLLERGHNWQKDILRNSFIQSYLASVRGGSKTVKYALSLGYDSDNGIIQNIHAYKRYTGRIKVDATPNEKLSVGASIGVNHSVLQEIRDRNNIQNPIRAMYSYLPYEPVYNSDGSYNSTSLGYSILEALLNNPEFNRSTIIDGNIYAQYRFLNDFTFKSQLGGYFNNYRSTSKSFAYSELSKILGNGGTVNEQNQNRFKYTNTNTINYVKSLGLHNIDFLGLLEYTEFKNDIIGARGQNLSPSTLSELSNTSTPQSTIGYKEHFRTFSYGAFLTYDYANKYILTATIRRDADSRFGKNNVYSDPFWSFSIAWNVTKENFLKDNNILSNLKIRASLGTRGYNNIALNLNNILISGGVYGNYPTLAPNARYGNPDLKWEVTKSYNIGTEFGFLKNRITGTLDFFKDQRKDFLLAISNYSTEGGSYQTTVNSGDLENKGVELSLNANIIRSRNFSWSIRMNSTYTNSKLNKLYGNEDMRNPGGSINALKVGQKPWTYYLVRSAGINPINGNELYLDKNGNITETYNSNDAVLLEGKSTLPKYYGGFGTTITFKGLDISADFSYKYGNYSYNYMARTMLNGAPNSNVRKDAINYWTTPGQTNVLPKPSNTGIRVTDRFLQNASYLRLRNVSIGYTFDKKTHSQLPVNKIRISLTGQNLATWTKFEGDPEVSIGSGENQTGTDQVFVSGSYSLFSYPNVKSYLFGIELEF